jgi:hypothetical protein
MKAIFFLLVAIIVCYTSLLWIDKSLIALVVQLSVGTIIMIYAIYLAGRNK